jgi:hypothetical protein
MSEQTVLYDIPNQLGVAWNPNPWKSKSYPSLSGAMLTVSARMILNYKNVDYKTEWVEYPDLAPKFKAFDIPPNPKDGPGYFTDYSSPAIKYADGTYQMDSWPIAHELERRYPSPSLHLDDPVVVQIRDQIASVVMPILPLIMPKVASLLNERSKPYFYETREQAMGVPLQEFEKNPPADCWEKAAGPAKEVGDLLRKHDGPFFLGKTGKPGGKRGTRRLC